MLYLSLRATNNWFEVIAIRIGLSIYCGWITAATILNTAFLLKAFGVKGDDLPLTEEWFGIITIWVAFALYNLISFFERDPAYGAVFLWALGWIFAEVQNEKPQFKNMYLHSLIALGTHGGLMFLLTLYLIIEYFQESVIGWYSPPSFWSHGLFYEITWYPTIIDVTPIKAIEILAQ